MQNTHRNNMRNWLLTSVSASALVAASSALAPVSAEDAPRTFLSVEGGATCGVNNVSEIARAPYNTPAGVLFNFRTGVEHRNDDCNITGRIGFGQQGVNIIPGLVNYWGIFARHNLGNSDNSSGNMTVDDLYYGVLYPNYTGPVTARTEEKRTVIDFEIGRDIGLGGGATARLIGGVRYAHFDGDYRLDGTLTYPAAYFYTLDVDSDTSFQGAGPRIGANFTMPLMSNVNLSVGGAVSVLYGKQEAKTNIRLFSSFFATTTQTFRKSSGYDWVANLEGEAALTTALTAGTSLTAGVRGEAWSDQATGPEGSEDGRFNWGPFVRVNINIDGP